MSLGYPQVSKVTGTVGAEAGQAITIALQFWSDAEDQVATAPVVAHVYLSTDAAGQALEIATSALSAGTDGTVLVTDTGVTQAWIISEADGDMDLVVTDTGTTTIYVNVVLNGVRTVFACPFA
jgi:hypothetical protein